MPPTPSLRDVRDWVLCVAFGMWFTGLAVQRTPLPADDVHGVTLVFVAGYGAAAIVIFLTRTQERAAGEPGVGGS